MIECSLDMDPLDRRVILVASQKELRKFYAQTKAAVVLDVFPDGLLWPTTSLIKKGLNSLSKNEYVSEMLSKHADSELIKEISEALELGGDLALIDPHKAIRAFKFGVGHTPVDGAIYVQHPIINDAYITPGEFSRTLSREKEAAFRQLASALGAKKLTLISAKVNESNALFGSKISLPDAASEVGIKTEFDTKGSVIKKVYSEFGEPRRAPWVPPDLERWVEMDPDFRTMVRHRIDGNLTKETITLEFKEGMGLGGEVAGKLAGKGFSIEGSYKQIMHSIWYFDVEYYPAV